MNSLMYDCVRDSYMYMFDNEDMYNELINLCKKLNLYLQEIDSTKLNNLSIYKNIILNFLDTIIPVNVRELLIEYRKIRINDDNKFILIDNNEEWYDKYYFCKYNDYYLQHMFYCIIYCYHDILNDIILLQEYNINKHHYYFILSSLYINKYNYCDYYNKYITLKFNHNILNNFPYFLEYINFYQ